MSITRKDSPPYRHHIGQNTEREGLKRTTAYDFYRRVNPSIGEFGDFFLVERRLIPLFINVLFDGGFGEPKQEKAIVLHLDRGECTPCWCVFELRAAVEKQAEGERSHGDGYLTVIPR